MLNNKEETVLVQTLIVHIINLNEQIDELEEKLKITKTRLNEVTGNKTVTYNIDKVTPF